LAGEQNKLGYWGFSRGIFQIKLGNFFGMLGKPEWGIPVVVHRISSIAREIDTSQALKL